MCAPASVTALHHVVSVSMFQAYLLSHMLGIGSLIGALVLCFRNEVSKIVTKFKNAKT